MARRVINDLKIDDLIKIMDTQAAPIVRSHAERLHQDLSSNIPVYQGRRPEGRKIYRDSWQLVDYNTAKAGRKSVGTVVYTNDPEAKSKEFVMRVSGDYRFNPKGLARAVWESIKNKLASDGIKSFRALINSI